MVNAKHKEYGRRLRSITESAGLSVFQKDRSASATNQPSLIYDPESTVKEAFAPLKITADEVTSLNFFGF